MSTITLSEDEKQKLVELARSAQELFVHRARLILAYAEGKPTLQAAREAGISRGRARHWKRQFLARGMNIFLINPSPETVSIKPDRRLYERVDNFIVKADLAEPGKLENLPKEEIPYPKPLPSIGLNVDDSLAEAGKKVWRYHFALMISHEQGTVKGEDIEELHDMRVATRRMRTAFDVFGQAFDSKTMKHYLNGLRDIGRGLGQVRDMDVILQNGIAYQKNLDEHTRPDLDPLIDEWERVIDKKRAKLVRHLQSEDYENFKRSFNEFLNITENETTPDSQSSGTIPCIRDIVPMLVYSRFAAVRAYESVLPTATVRQLHALRIEFKKFRYTLEYFREVLDAAAGKAINEIKQYQDHLGELHDADVGCQLVSDFLKSWGEKQIRQPIPERINPETIVSYLAFLHAERYRLMVGFPPLWQRFSRPEFRHNLSQAISSL